MKTLRNIFSVAIFLVATCASAAEPSADLSYSQAIDKIKNAAFARFACPVSIVGKLGSFTMGRGIGIFMTLDESILNVFLGKDPLDITVSPKVVKEFDQLGDNLLAWGCRKVTPDSK